MNLKKRIQTPTVEMVYDDHQKLGWEPKDRHGLQMLNFSRAQKGRSVVFESQN